jgi:hypothetical protein
LTGKATFDVAIEVVPVIEQTPLDARLRHDVEAIQRLPRLQQSQEMEGAVQHSDVRIAGNDGGRVAIHGHAADHIPLVACALERQAQSGDQRRAARRAEQQGARLRGRCDLRDGSACQSANTAHQFALRHSQGLGAGGCHQFTHAGRERAVLACIGRAVTQP